jgi:hypothetical protein
MEVEVSGRAVTIVETRAPWTPAIGPEWTRMPIGRLRHHATHRTWSLFWRDRNLHWHRYDRTPPSSHVEPLLTEIADDPMGIFWG